MIRCYNNLLLVLFSAIVLGLAGCDKQPTDNPTPPVPFHYKTENVVIVVVDGARYTETWGDPVRRFIPKRNALL